MAKKLSVAERRKKTPIVKGFVDAGDMTFVFWCPWCRKNHVHGWPAQSMTKKYDEHRVAHCHIESSPFIEYGYFLQPFTTKEIQEMTT